MVFLEGSFDDSNPEHKLQLVEYLQNGDAGILHSGSIIVENGAIVSEVTLMSARSVAEDDFRHADRGRFARPHAAAASGNYATARIRSAGLVLLARPQPDTGALSQRVADVVE